MSIFVVVVTPFGSFYYVTMPFGINNVGAIYQRCMWWCLHPQIKRNVEAYMDEVILKSKKVYQLIDDLAETFSYLIRFDMKLNLEKWICGVPFDKLFG